MIFIIGDWNTKVGSQEIPGIAGKFGLGVQNEAGQRLTEFCQENADCGKRPLLTAPDTTLYMEMIRDHSVIFEIASKYCISDSSVDYDGYSISSKGFLPTVVDTMVM